MKHLKGVNRKGRRIEKEKGDLPVVEAQGSIPFMHTCTSVFNPAGHLQQPGLERRLHPGDEGLDEAQGRQAGVVGSGGAINDTE
ncbi:MAG: hypothetical protein H6Q79_1823 [Deltaproteobacteria bacterium]|nr:hypothetical protein [Deltaproteobacteria bacterium]